MMKESGFERALAFERELAITLGETVSFINWTGAL